MDQTNVRDVSRGAETSKYCDESSNELDYTDQRGENKMKVLRFNRGVKSTGVSNSKPPLRSIKTVISFPIEDLGSQRALNDKTARAAAQETKRRVGEEEHQKSRFKKETRSKSRQK